MSGLEGEVIDSAVTSGLGGIIAYLVIREIKEFRRENREDFASLKKGVMAELERLKEAYYILVDAQTDELKKKSEMLSREEERDAVRRTIRR